MSALTLPIQSGSLEQYVASVQAVPMLSQEEEHALALRFRDSGDLDAARQLVLAHLRFVVKVARGYQGYGLAQNDLIQEGTVGLMKAVKRFQPEVGVRLVSFAVHWIRAEIHEFIIKNWRIVKVATTKAQRKLFFNLRSAKKRLGWLNASEVDDVARELGVKPADVLAMEQRLAAYDESFDGPTTDDDVESVAPARVLPDPGADPAVAIEDRDLEQSKTTALRDALSELDERSQMIVMQRWLTEDSKMTLQDLAEQFGVSAERIRQIEKAALTKLKDALATRFSELDPELLPAPSATH